MTNEDNFLTFKYLGKDISIYLEPYKNSNIWDSFREIEKDGLKPLTYKEICSFFASIREKFDYVYGIADKRLGGLLEKIKCCSDKGHYDNFGVLHQNTSKLIYGSTAITIYGRVKNKRDPKVLIHYPLSFRDKKLSEIDSREILEEFENPETELKNTARLILQDKFGFYGDKRTGAKGLIGEKILSLMSQEKRYYIQDDLALWGEGTYIPIIRNIRKKKCIACAYTERYDTDWGGEKINHIPSEWREWNGYLLSTKDITEDFSNCLTFGKR